MADKKKFRVADLFTLLSLICLAVAFLSIFLPLAKMQVPIVGTRSVSAFSTVSQLLEIVDSRVQDPGAPTPVSGKLDSIKLNSLVDLQNTVTAKQDIFQANPVYHFIPIGMVLGIVAHLLLIVLALGFFLRNLPVSLMAAGGAWVSSLSFLVSLFLLDDATRHVMQSSMKELEDNPFVGLVQAFVGGVKVEPGIAAYLLPGGTFLIFVFIWIEKNYELD